MPSPPSASETVAAPLQLDGSYRGIARLVRAAAAHCPRSGNRTVVVNANALSLSYRGPAASYPLVATVAADGSIRGSDGRGTVVGKIDGRHMDLTVSSDYCELRYALERG